MAIATINPATGEVIKTFPALTEAEIETKLQLAVSTFKAERKTPFAVRAKRMLKAAEILERDKEKFAHLMTLEMGKPYKAAVAEAVKCTTACRYYAENTERFMADEVVETGAKKSFIRYLPIGPILAVMPWNFPFWQVIRFAAPALMAGNVAVLKHAPNVPGCALAIERTFAEAGFPAGVLGALLISDNAAAQRLVDHPVIRAVTLTGSERAGAAVAAAAGGRLKKTVMELGGSDAFIVLADANVEQAAAKAAEARCINNGQSCIAAKRFIVEGGIADRFEKAIVSAMSAMKVGDPMDRSTQIGPLARLDLLDALHGQVRTSIEQGAKLRLGGRRRSGKGFFYEPTVLAEVRPGMAAFDEETFGPVAAIIRAVDAEDAVRLANQSRYGLGASIWTKDADRAELLAGEIESGCVFINGMVKSDPRLPFGGIKNSGWGRELSQFGIHEFVNIKTIWIK